MSSENIIKMYQKTKTINNLILFQINMCFDASPTFEHKQNEVTNF